MKNFLRGCVIPFVLSGICFHAFAFDYHHFNTNELYFAENKGQVCDQNGKIRNDISYFVRANGLCFYTGAGKMHYEFLQRQNDKNTRVAHDLVATGALPATGVPDLADKLPADVASYRVDVELVGANMNHATVDADPQPYYEIYYPVGAPNNGIKVHTYKKITYKNVYPGIDWVIRVHETSLEYDFMVAPGADPSVIQMQYSGQSRLQVNKDGSITAVTPMGTIHEHAPVCYSAGTGSPIAGGFRLTGDRLGFDIGTQAHSFVIDPAVEWGTYYGPNTSTSPAYALACDAEANVYMCGLTYSATLIATSGAYSDTFAGVTDAYLVKFDSAGHRQWGSYYGNSSTATGAWGGAFSGTWGAALACDPAGNVYLGGSTGCNVGIATPGAALDTFGGGQWVVFLAKFNTAGERQWCTYVGGSPGRTFDIEVATVFCDSNYHVYVSGSTDDSCNIGTVGTFKPWKHIGPDSCIDDYVMKFDTSGNKMWGTYYGPNYINGKSYTGGGCSDNLHVYLSGWTNDTESSTIGTIGSHQPTYGGGTTEAFLVQLDETGNRRWGTYFGDTATLDDSTQEGTGGVTCDYSGNIYMLGVTSSSACIATAGCFQPTYAGNIDAFLAKFDPEIGGLDWATYYGGDSVENTTYSNIVCDHSGNVFITGYTNSNPTGIASAGAWQTTFGGDPDDAFVAEFTPTGEELWSSYLGGDGSDWGYGTAYDGYAVYVCGHTTSDNKIATADGFQPTGGSPGSNNYQGFLVKILPNDSLSLSTAHVNAKNKVSLFPDPNKGTFTVKGSLPGVSNAQIQIFDVTGKTVYSQSVKVNAGIIYYTVDLQDVASGAYFLQLSGDGVTKTTLKFTVE